MARVLIVEDDTDLRARLKRTLEAENHDVDAAESGASALQQLQNKSFDLLVLDFNLPDMTGVDICKSYRQAGGKSPVMFLTGMGDIDHKALGFDSGGDDYLTKPFDERELKMRVKGLLRRTTPDQQNDLSLKGLVLKMETRTVEAGMSRIRLTNRECSLLEFMIRNPDKFFTASDLKGKVWPSERQFTDESVRTCMKTLRQKLAEIGFADLVKTVAGAGYIAETN